MAPEHLMASGCQAWHCYQLWRDTSKCRRKFCGYSHIFEVWPPPMWCRACQQQAMHWFRMLPVVNENGISQALPLDKRQAEVAWAQHAPRTLQSTCSTYLLLCFQELFGK